MSRLHLILCLVLFGLLCVPTLTYADGQQTGGRFAVVIGNSDYPGPRIPGTADAHDMALALDQLGFTVIGGTTTEKALLDADFAGMTHALEAVSKAISNTTIVPDVVLFYFSGHGFQLEGEDYLLPARTSNVTDLKKQVISLQDVITYLGQGDNFPHYASKIVLLDACRSNASLRINGEDPGKVPGWQKGFTKYQHDPPPQTMIFFATAYGDVADGTPIAGHSPFTNSLLIYIGAAGLELRDLLNSVVVDTQSHTQPQQIPKDEFLSNIPAPFFFRKPVEVGVRIKEVDDGVFVLAGANEATRWIDEPEARVPFYLKSGRNEVSVKVFNQKTYRNHHSWDKPEGWKYRVEISMSGQESNPFWTAFNKEEVPHKDGPRFGKLFPVATAVINVHPSTAAITVSDEWKLVIPSEENEDNVLYQQAVQVLGINLNLVIGGRENLRDAVKQCVGKAESSGALAQLFAQVVSALIQGKSADDPINAFNNDFTRCVGDSVWVELE